MKLSKSSKISHKRNLAWRIIDGEAIIVTSKDSSIHSLNRVGTRIWELCDGKRTAGDISKIISEEFEVTSEKAFKDIEEFLGALSSKGIVTVRKTKAHIGK